MTHYRTQETEIKREGKMSLETWRTDWIKTKRDIAMCLAKGACGGSYGEAVIILCAAISALAADVWPGRGKDRERFIELLTKFAPCTTRISIPILVELLSNQGRCSESNALKTAFLNNNQFQILSGDVDKFENEILGICPSLNRKEIRDFSYATLLYKEIRCSYSHQYGPWAKAESWNMGAQPSGTGVTYLNEVSNGIYKRHIHFDVQWIGDGAIAVASAIDAIENTEMTVGDLEEFKLLMRRR
ncbi:MAG: hypothetical protein ACT4O2_01755 [Beijerinckiaceae bacterium]